MKIFSGSSNIPLAQKVAKELKTELSRLELYAFPDGEKRVHVLDKVVGQDCAALQSTATNADKNYMELFFMVDALKRSGAKTVTAVIPYLGYQRQDHVFREGEAVSLEVIIKMLETVGADKVITFDLHSVKIPELFHIPLIHLSALSLFAEKIREFVARGPAARFPHPMSSVDKLPAGTRWGSPTRVTPRSDTSNVVLISPDMGGIRRIKILSKMLNGMPYATIVKNRDLATGKISANEVKGEIKSRAIIVDDMISTGSTIVAAANLLLKKGVKEILVFATHPVFSLDAAKMLQKSSVKKVFATDTIDVPKDKLFPKLEVLSVGEMIAISLSS